MLKKKEFQSHLLTWKLMSPFRSHNSCLIWKSSNRTCLASWSAPTRTAASWRCNASRRSPSPRTTWSCSTVLAGSWSSTSWPWICSNQRCHLSASAPTSATDRASRSPTRTRTALPAADRAAARRTTATAMATAPSRPARTGSTAPATPNVLTNHQNCHLVTAESTAPTSRK